MSLVQDEIVETSEQAYQAMQDEWVSALVMLWEAVGKPVDEARLKIYAKQFEMIPLGLLEKMVSRALVDNGQYQTVPTIGALWSAFKKEVGDMPGLSIEEGIDKWLGRRLESIVYRF